MAYIVIRNTRTGYVSLVEKRRDNQGNVKTKAYICGLGTMTMEEFKNYQKWAHSMKDQEYRKNMVLNSGIAIITKEKVDKRVVKSKQRKTTVKRPPKEIKEISEKEEELRDTKHEKELREQELRVIANLTPVQQKKRLRDLIDDQKDLQVKFKKLSGRKEDIQKDSIRNPHKVEGNVKHVIFINEQQKEIRDKIRIMNKEKQLYKDSLKKFGGRW